MTIFDRRADYDKFMSENAKIERPDRIIVHKERIQKTSFSRIIMIVITALIIGVATAISITILVKIIVNLLY